MNQILQIENKKSKEPIEISKIVKFFAIAITIFAVIIIGLGSYAIISQKSKKQQNNNIEQENVKPQVDINVQENEIIIDITHTIPISKIVYNWNNEADTTIDCGNRTNLSETISLPFGTNTLNLTVIDTNGEETKFIKEYDIEQDGKPVIELKLTKDNKIKILIQDDNNIKSASYTWNNNETEKISINKNSLDKVEYEVEIPAGQNTLKVQAINENDLSTTKELQVKGVKKPLVKIKKDGDYIIIRAEDEGGMKLVNYTLNGQRYQINYGNKTIIEYRQKIPEGESLLELSAENQDGGIATVKAKIIN